jgi:virginiamycin B lyase
MTGSVRLLAATLAVCVCSCTSTSAPTAGSTPTTPVLSPSGPVTPPPPVTVAPSGAATEPTQLRLPHAVPLPAAATRIKIPFLSGAPVGAFRLGVTSAGVWVSNGVLRVDPETNTSSHAYQAGLSLDLATGDGSVWASDYDAGVVRRYDTAGRLIATIQLPNGSNPEGIAVTSSSVWVASHHAGTVIRIDPRTNRVVTSVALSKPADGGPQGVGFGFGSIWVTNGNTNEVLRIDPSTNSIIARIQFLDMVPCGGFAFGRTAVWITECLDGTHIARIDPRTNTVAAVLDTGGRMNQPAADGDTAWVVAGGDPDNSPQAPGYLLQLRSNDTVARRIALGPGFISGGTAVAFGSVWMSSFNKSLVIRIPRPS